MIGDDNLFDGGIIGIGVAFVGWLMNRSIRRIDRDIEEHDERIKQAARERTDDRLDLANFKTEVAKEYAKDTTVQQSLARLHDRFDEGQERNEENFADLRTDIKTLIGKVGK